jgi:hypothetical protein
MIVLSLASLAILCALCAVIGTIIGYALCMGDVGSLTRQDGAQ